MQERELEEAMSSSAWLAKLNLSPEAACRCGHNAHVHAHGKSCTAVIDESKMKYCKCEQFREASGSQIQTGQGDEMATKEKKARKPKGEGRKPTLAPFVDAPFKVYVTFDGKERDAMVLSSGVIRYKEKEFTSPSGFANAVIKEVGAKGRADGWKVVTFNKDGERVALDTLRGSKSPLKAEAPKKERKAKTAKPNGSAKVAKPKAARKPRAKKPNGAATPGATLANELQEGQAAGS
jgi:hypothetical protein